MSMNVLIELTSQAQYNMAALFDNYIFVLQYRQKQKQLNFTWELNHTEHVGIQIVK